MKLNKILSFLSLAILLLFTVACGSKDEKPVDPEAEWKDKTVYYIEEVESYTSIAYEYDEFELSMIKIKVYYTDDTSREIPLTADMLSEKDLEKLTKVGQPRVEVTYKDAESIRIVIKLVDSSLLDQNLNADGEYGAVIKAIRDGNTINFIADPNANCCAFQFKYTFDNTIMQVSNATEGSAQGVYSIDLSQGNSILAMIVLDEEITTETILFSVTLEGNFRTSGLSIDETYTNKVYTHIGEYKTEEIEKVLYHASIK